jgi:hypothetical protein
VLLSFFVRSNHSTSEDPVFISFGISLEVGLISIKQRIKKVSLTHAAPACAGSGDGSGHIGFYAGTLSLHFCKRLLSGLEPMTSWSQGKSFTAAPAPHPIS